MSAIIRGLMKIALDTRSHAINMTSGVRSGWLDKDYTEDFIV
jgi:hypothetical protein